jgi:glutamine amidotransferase/cyclase
VRNLGKPVALARRYYEEGADEIVFLNITSFREVPVGQRVGWTAGWLVGGLGRGEGEAPRGVHIRWTNLAGADRAPPLQEILEDTPMLRVLEEASENIFVPLTVGGGIRGYQDASGKAWSALEVAARLAPTSLQGSSLQG